jgi:hypothetical protein
MVQTLHEFIKTERVRLEEERKTIVAQQGELENKLADIDRERAAIAAYEITRSGKFAQPKKPAAGRASNKRPVSGGRRRGSKRAALLSLIKENPSGLKRAEIFEKMGLKGDKLGEMSVSNALAALAKSKQLTRQDEKYFIGAA